jgi:MoaE-MoaD fusion protein
MIHPSPNLCVVLFAGMAATAGRRILELPWKGGTVAELRRRLATVCPEIVPLLANSAVAIGDRYAADGEPVAAGDDVAIVPPVSGG